MSMPLQATSAFGPANQLILEPYVTPATFTAAPTWLDVDDLIPGGLPQAQAGELLNVLLRASAWCDVIVGGAENPWLGAHSVTENFRARGRRDGSLSLHPKHAPVRQVVSLYTGTNPLSLLPQTVSNLWIEDGRQIIVPAPGNGLANFSGLQFGSSIGSPNWQTYIQLTYISGWFNSTLTSATAANAASIPVLNPAGLNPGDQLRINDPYSPSGPTGGEEFATVANTFVPTTTPNTSVPLAGTLLNAHALGAGATCLPMNIQQAAICYGVGLLLREDVTFEEPFAETNVGPSARMSMSGGIAGGLIEEAVRLLQPYSRVR